MNKTVLITGATGGIGGAMAAAFARAGARLILIGTRREVLDTLADKLSSEGAQCKGVVCNLREEGAIESLTKDVGESVDILINNAGITRDGLFMRMSDDDVTAVLETNLVAAFRLTRALVRPMMKRRWGRIINISSVVSAMGNPGQANYAASKAGLEGLTRTLARELAARGITVNAIAPGFTRSAMTDALTPAQQEQIAAMIPLGRVAEPEEIAASAVFLASEDAGYITGHTLHINGGMHCG
ncbi:MAG: 3-oxoacyl-[acyl-carrier-protein] reductase [Pseudomonadota bacterium]